MKSPQSLLIVRLSAVVFAAALWASAVAAAAAAASTAVPEASARLERELAAEVDRFVEADRASPPPPCQVLFVGSSSIAKWRDTLAADMAPMPVINRGFGGSKMTDLLYYMDRIVLPYKPRMIVINEGGNDIHAGRTPEQLLANIKTFVKKVRAVMPGVPIAFSGLTSSPARITETAQRLHFNHLLKTYLAHGKKLIYLDLFNDFVGTDGMPRKELFVQDQLHDSEAGYAIRVRVVRPFLGPPDYPDRKPAP